MLSHSASSGSLHTGLPARSIALIAFFTMEVGMNPRFIDTFVLLRGLVRPLPIALGVPPQSGEGER